MQIFQTVWQNRTKNTTNLARKSHIPIGPRTTCQKPIKIFNLCLEPAKLEMAVK